MDFEYNRTIRIISIIVLSFFLWTFGGVFEVAYAFNSNQPSAISSQHSKAQKPEEKFGKTINDIEQILNDTATDTDTKKNKLRIKKTEIETLDIDIKKQFQETEKKLITEGLPLEILQRHYNFVRHYEDNLSELKGNLDAIDRATTKGEADSAIEKAKAHLEKVRPPNKHIPLDPNKLPHRTAEPVFIEPRTSPEQFFEMQAATPFNPPLPRGELKGGNDSPSRFTSHDARILVASNGPLDGLLDADSKYSVNAVIPAKAGIQSSGYPIEAFGYDKLNKGSSNALNLSTSGLGISNSPMLVAAATNLPTPADLAETIEVQFTPEIRAKAQELNYNPVKIYNWVRNNIEFVPTYGSIQGANMCLQTKQCNAFDTASLLIALLRASNIPARYVYGTIELPIEKVKNWVGGFTDSNAALTLIASGGIPVTGLTSGGKIVMVRMEHVWVEAYVPYGNYRGSIRDDSIKTWIPMDGCFKQYNYLQGLDFQAITGFDAQAFLQQLQPTATIDPLTGSITNINSLTIQNKITQLQTQIQNYINANMPNATVRDAFGGRSIISENLGLLPSTLPYKKIATLSKYSAVPDNLGPVPRKLCHL